MEGHEHLHAGRPEEQAPNANAKHDGAIEHRAPCTGRNGHRGKWDTARGVQVARVNRAKQGGKMSLGQSKSKEDAPKRRPVGLLGYVEPPDRGSAHRCSIPKPPVRDAGERSRARDPADPDP